MIGSLGYDPATMTSTDALGIVGASIGVGFLALAVMIVVILVRGPRP